MKITVVGIGKVGSTVAFVLARDGLATELVLHNRTRAKARADALDIQQAVAFVPHRVHVRDGDIAETAGSDLVINCLGVASRPDEHDRNAVAEENTRLVCQVLPPLLAASPDAIVINVTNPLDVITHHLLAFAGRPAERVIGTGTLIDSARFRELLGEQLGIHPVDLNAYVLGEHGETQFAALSAATCGGEPIDATADRCLLIEQAKASAWEVFGTKGYTNYAVAMAVQLIVQSVVEDLRYTLPVSVLIDGYCGVQDVCLSVPCVIGRQGVHMKLRPALCESECQQFRRSAAAVRAVIDRTRPIVEAMT